MQTPEFLVWAIERHCPLRKIAGFEDPERTERHLRTLRAYSDGAAGRRVFEGICVAPPSDAEDPLQPVGKIAFRVEDALSLYGGLPAAEAACRPCPANALQQRNPQSLAGCFGIVPLPASEAVIHVSVEEAIDRLNALQNVKASFPSTAPAWYGLWQHSPLAGPRALLLAFILTETKISDPVCRRSMDDLIVGLRAAWKGSLPLHVTLYPRGEVQGTWWTLVPHCQACKAAWPEAERGTCPVCGYVGNPASSPKRRARGARPYWPLERMLGQEKAEEFLVRYEANRLQAKSYVHPSQPQ